jgi:hypothetical protein
VNPLGDKGKGLFSHSHPLVQCACFGVFVGVGVWFGVCCFCAGLVLGGFVGVWGVGVKGGKL